MEEALPSGGDGGGGGADGGGVSSIDKVMGIMVGINVLAVVVAMRVACF